MTSPFFLGNPPSTADRNMQRQYQPSWMDALLTRLMTLTQLQTNRSTQHYLTGPLGLCSCSPATALLQHLQSSCPLQHALPRKTGPLGQCHPCQNTAQRQPRQSHCRLQTRTCLTGSTTSSPTTQARTSQLPMPSRSAPLPSLVSMQNQLSRAAH
jgi:hypothetical protein